MSERTVRTLVANRSETSNRSQADGREQRLMPEVFSSCRVREMHLDRREPHGADGIAQRNRRVGVPARIEERTVCPLSSVMEMVDKLSFAVRLQGRNLVAEVGRQRRDRFFDLGQRGRAVDLRFAGAEQIEVWTVQEQESHPGIVGGVTDWALSTEPDGGPKSRACQRFAFTTQVAGNAMNASPSVAVGATWILLVFVATTVSPDLRSTRRLYRPAASEN